MIKCPGQNNLKEKGLILSPKSRLQSTIAGNQTAGVCSPCHLTPQRRKEQWTRAFLISFFSIYSPSSPTQGLAQQPKRGLLHQITIKIIPDTFQVLNLIKATLHRCTWRLGLTVSSTAENGLASRRGSQHSQHP